MDADSQPLDMIAAFAERQKMMEQRVAGMKNTTQAEGQPSSPAPPPPEKPRDGAGDAALPDDLHLMDGVRATTTPVPCGNSNDIFGDVASASSPSPPAPRPNADVAVIIQTPVIDDVAIPAHALVVVRGPPPPPPVPTAAPAAKADRTRPISAADAEEKLRRLRERRAINDRRYREKKKAERLRLAEGGKDAGPSSEDDGEKKKSKQKAAKKDARDEKAKREKKDARKGRRQESDGGSETDAKHIKRVVLVERIEKKRLPKASNAERVGKLCRKLAKMRAAAKDLQDDIDRTSLKLDELVALSDDDMDTR
jgi:hypothetical protein